MTATGSWSRARRFLLAKNTPRYWVLGLLIFVVPMILTVLLQDLVKESPLGVVVERALEGVRERARSVEGFENALARIAATFALILANNVLVALVMALTSVTVVVPIAVIAFNGVLTGYVIGTIVGEPPAGPEGQLLARDVSSIGVFAALTPHGVIEIPALALLAAPLLAINVLGYKEAVKTCFSLVPVVIVLLAVAALVESTITLIGLGIVQAITG